MIRSNAVTRIHGVSSTKPVELYQSSRQLSVDLPLLRGQVRAESFAYLLQPLLYNHRVPRRDSISVRLEKITSTKSVLSSQRPFSLHFQLLSTDSSRLSALALALTNSVGCLCSLHVCIRYTHTYTHTQRESTCITPCR